VITARALGVYVYLKASGAHISSENLSSIFPEGRKAMMTALRELREAGLIVTSRQLVNGKFVTQSYLNGSPEKELLLQQNMQNSNKSLLAYSFNSKPNSERSSREGILEYYETEEERLEAKRKHDQRKHEEKMEAYEARRQDRMVKRDRANAAGWSSTDSAFEFAEQMHNLWHIQPWEVTRSRFRYALDAKRKEYNTDGTVEAVMMELYFSKLKHDTKISDPEKVWKMFIVQFSNLLTEAQRVMVTPEDVIAEKDKGKHTLDWMDDV